ncbi:unnamed protein product [Alternaria alternata]
MADNYQPICISATEAPPQESISNDTLYDRNFPIVRPCKTPFLESDSHGVEDDITESVVSSPTHSELDMPVASNWRIAGPASLEVRREIQRGSLIAAPIPQFAKDKNGKRKLTEGFFKSPKGMMLIKKYPLVVYDVDRDQGRLPTKLYCMQRHTYGEGGLKKGDRLREDHHLHVKLIPPGKNKNDKGVAPNDPLLIRELYNTKFVPENAYLEFKSIVVVELDEHVDLDGQLEPSSWFDLFGLYISTIVSAANDQLKSTPSHKWQAKTIVNSLVNAFVENLDGPAGAVSTGRHQTSALDEVTPPTQIAHGEVNKQISSTSTFAQNQLIETRNGNISQQATEVQYARERSENYGIRERSRSPRRSSDETSSEHDNRARNYWFSLDYGDERRRPGGDWQSSRREDRHTVRDSRRGGRNRRSDYNESPVLGEDAPAEREYHGNDRQFDRLNGWRQGRVGGMNANRRDGGSGRDGRS